MHTRHRHLRAITRTAPLDNGDPNPSGGAPSSTPPATPPANPPADSFDPAKLSPEAKAYIAQQVKAADEKARTTTRDNASKAATDAVLQTIATALGQKPAEVDPAAVAAELKAARESNATMRTEVAVERAARKAGADEDLVTAKLLRDGKLRGLDPEASDFADKVKALVDEAIAANPRLKLDTTTPPPPAAQGAGGTHSAPAGGEGGNARPKSLADALGKIKL
jgi:hypothetical protein